MAQLPPSNGQSLRKTQALTGIWAILFNLAPSQYCHFVGVLEILPSSLSLKASSSETGAASQLWLHELLEYLPNNYLGIEAMELRPGSGGTPLPSALVLARRQLHVPSFPRREGFTKWPRQAENSPFYNAGWCQVCNPPASVSPALRLQIHTTRLSFVPVFSRNSSQ